MSNNYQSLEEKKDKNINILDIIKYLLFHWKWFALSIFIFGTYYFYQYSKSPFVYSRSQTIMIKTPANTPATARITRTNVGLNPVSVASEILQLKSKELMRHTIKQIGAEMSYSIKRDLRQTELYDKSPVTVKIFNMNDEKSYSFYLTPLSNTEVLLTGWGGDGKAEGIKVPLNKSVNTPAGKLLVTPTVYYSSQYFEERIRVEKFALEYMVNYFIGNLKIKQMEEDASLLEVDVTDSHPDRAADLLTTLIKVYNQFTLQDKNQIAINTAEFIRERLSIIESELGSVESNIEHLKTANQGVDVSNAGQMYVNDSRTFEGERNKIETEMKLAKMMQEYLKDKAKQSELIPNNTGLVDASVESQIVEYNATLLNRNRLVEGSSTANPVVQELDRTLNTMRGGISRAVDNTLAGLDIKMQNAQREERTARGKAMTVPAKQRVMLSIERQQKVKEELYVYLLNKREENALNQAMTEDNIRIIDPPTGSNYPIYPSRLKKVGTGLAIGIVLPAVILLLMLVFDSGVRDRNDIESVLTVPFLGEIPLVKNRKGGSSDILVTGTGRDPLTESFRIIRTNINFMTRNGVHPQVITFTSFGIGVGKTFSALNLSTALSFLGKRIAIVDLDLRKGTLSSRMELPKGRGISHYLSDNLMCIDDIVIKDVVSENIDFFPIGTIAPNPVELLLSDRLDQLMADLRKKYDYIVVDGVPVGIVADASIVDRISDLTMFVIRVGKMDRRQLPEIEKLYQTGKLSHLAIVLNGVSFGGRYGYGGYGYGNYGYGYGQEIDRKNRLFGWFNRS